jgi:hypothetical protein
MFYKIQKCLEFSENSRLFQNYTLCYAVGMVFLLPSPFHLDEGLTMHPLTINSSIIQGRFTQSSYLVIYLFLSLTCYLSCCVIIWVFMSYPLIANIVRAENVLYLFLHPYCLVQELDSPNKCWMVK